MLWYSIVVSSNCFMVPSSGPLTAPDFMIASGTSSMNLKSLSVLVVLWVLKNSTICSTLGAMIRL